MNADVLPPYIELEVDLESWNLLVYCGAVAVVKMLGMDVEVEAEAVLLFSCSIVRTTRRYMQSRRCNTSAVE